MRWFLILVVFLFGGPALADRPRIPGEDAAGFTDALEAWLDGDDLTALNDLKGLAEEGNTAAQILLARIAEEPHMHRHVTGGMARADRIALLRQPGGLSGTSWLEAAQGESELAQALILGKTAFTSEKTSDGRVIAPEAMQAVRMMLGYGEVALATEVAFKLFDGGFLREILSLMDEHGVQLDRIAKLLEISALIGLNPDMPIDEIGRAAGGVQPQDILSLRHIHPQVLKDSPQARDAVVRFSEMVIPWTPLRELCEISCPNSYNECLIAGVTSIGVARRYPFASPVESLVPQEEYWHSARLRGDIARRLFELDRDFAIGASFDQCFADTISALAQ